MLRRQPYQRWLAILGYLFVALYVTAPIHSELSSRFLGADSGDVYESARHIWWYKTALQTGEDVFHHSLLSYPEGFRATSLWANPLQFFPMWLFAFLVPLPLAYNAGVLLTLALNGLSMYVLARRMLASTYRFPAFVAGLVFILFPAIQGQVLEGRIGSLVQWPAPLLILYLFDYADHGGKRRLVIAALLFMLTALGSTAQLVTMLAPLVFLFALARIHRRDQVGALRALVVAAVGCAGLLMFLSPVLADALANPQPAASSSLAPRGIDLLSAIKPSVANPFWSNMVSISQPAGESNLGGRVAYIGVIGAFLALLGVLFRRGARWFLLTGFVAWLLALGPLLRVNDQVAVGSIGGYPAVVPLPFAVLSQLPIAQLAQDPAHFLFLFAAMLSLLAGFGTDVCCSSRVIQRRGPLAQLVIAAIFVILLAEDYKLFAAFPSVTAEIPREIHNLWRRRDIGAIYNVPHDDDRVFKEALYLQTAHAKPLIAGQNTRLSTVDRARLALLAKLRPPLLQEAGADIVIINKARAIESGQLDLFHWRARQELGEPLYEDQRFAVYETPDRRDRAPAVYSPVAEAQSHVTFIYKEQPGWLQFDAVLEAVNRNARLSLNNRPLETLQVKGRIPLSIPLPIDRRGYHTLTIAPDPPCPERFDANVLHCQRVTVENVRIEVLSDGAIYDPIRIEDGIVLAGYLLPEASAGDLIKIRFWWRFEADRSENDVRFVHVLDAGGRLVPGSPPDHHFGVMPAGRELTETVALDKSLLEPGEYRVLTGWYELPQAIRYDVLTDVEGAQDDTVVLGAIRIRA
ncbi:MAG: 6-pyruvoyl-tetrahydropterin synthase-related protein [Chloroflexota bacterium]|nr:6-pyruvoyl-tetrahydropterin synthase-related protein [Chloroflexota bacterium]